MPIKIQDALPAREILENENIFVMTEYRAMHQDIRPLNVLMLNLMPTKIVTETQFLRKLSNTPLQVEVEFLHMASHMSTHVDQTHLSTFYQVFEQIQDKKYDGMIITGAPLDFVEFEDVDYWEELKRIMEWTKTNVHCTLHSCWGSFAGLYYHHGIRKRDRVPKLSGIYSHQVVKKIRLCSGDLTMCSMRRIPGRRKLQPARSKRYQSWKSWRYQTKPASQSQKQLTAGSFSLPAIRNTIRIH